MLKSAISQVQGWPIHGSWLEKHDSRFEDIEA
jgi:hypothetical protein